METKQSENGLKSNQGTLSPLKIPTDPKSSITTKQATSPANEKKRKKQPSLLDKEAKREAEEYEKIKDKEDIELTLWQRQLKVNRFMVEFEIN